MKKLGVLVQFKCAIALRYTCLCYVVQVLFLLIYLTLLQFNIIKNTNKYFLEIGTITILIVYACYGFQDRFNMAIQNGFHRVSIYTSTILSNMFIVTAVSFVDTSLGTLLETSVKYSSMITMFTAYEYPFIIKWLLLWLIYFCSSSLAYLTCLFIRKFGKKILIISVPLTIIVIFRLATTLEGGIKGDGSKDVMYPLTNFLVVLCLIFTCGYCVIRKIEVDVAKEKLQYEEMK